MENPETTNYILSPYLLIETEKSSPGQFKLLNSLSGKAYQVRESVVQILRYLNIPRTLDAIAAHFDQHAREELGQVIGYFTEKGIVFKSDILAEQLTLLTSLKQTLFGLNDRLSDSFANLCFIGIPFGGGNPKSVGSAYFPEKVREYTNKYSLTLGPEQARTMNLEAVGISPGKTDIPDLLEKDLIKDLGNLFVSIHESKAFIYQKIEQIAYRVFKEGNVPFFLGGDHSITYPVIKAATDVYDNIYVVQLDAHTDTYASKYDQLNHREKVHHHGNFAARSMQLPNVKGFYQLGIRGVFNLLGNRRDPKQHIFWCAELKETLLHGCGLPEVPEGANVYLTVDIDVLDPNSAPGTATPVANGLYLAELIQLLNGMLAGRRIIGADLVEVNPELDEGELTMQTSVELILNMLGLFPLTAKQPDAAAADQELEVATH